MNGVAPLHSTTEMFRYYAIGYQSSPLCREKTFVCCVKVGEGENGPEKAIEVLRKYRGRVFVHSPKEVNRSEAKRLAPNLFKK